MEWNTFGEQHPKKCVGARMFQENMTMAEQGVWIELKPPGFIN
jgi:hypothetical protein